MRNQKQKVGSRGEDIAAKFLLRNGYKIIERNWRSKIGEIDIVAKKGDALIIVEVKSGRKNNIWPEENITIAKKRKLKNLSRLYLLSKQIPLNSSFQIDVVAVEFGQDDEIEIRHIPNAVWE